MIYLQRSEYARRGFEDAVNAVCHVKAMGPVVVGNLTVVFLDGDEEANQDLVVEALQSEEVHKHVQSLPHLHHVVHVQGIKGEAKGKDSQYYTPGVPTKSTNAYNDENFAFSPSSTSTIVL